MPRKEYFARNKAIEYLSISGKHFDNYNKFSKELGGVKKNKRWRFDRNKLDLWKKQKNERTVVLGINEYKESFKLAMKMAYAKGISHGGGIRGDRSEMQVADDWIRGILAEHGLKKFLKKKFNVEIKLDTEAHPGQITPQDIICVKKNRSWRKPYTKVGIKGSKLKSCFLVLQEIEVIKKDRKSDVYVFGRVDLPSDHLFRILRDHFFFKSVKNFLNRDDRFNKMEELKKIPVWICGYVYRKDLERKKRIPGQVFDGYRYVKNVKDLKNSQAGWKKFCEKL